MSDYHINLFYSDEDSGYIADIPDLKSCSAFGTTPEEALREVQIAKKAWLETCRARKKPVPKPRYRPAIYAADAESLSARRPEEPNGSRRCQRSAHLGRREDFDFAVVLFGLLNGLIPFTSEGRYFRR